VCNKTEKIHELIIDRSIDVLALTETWLQPGDEPVINDLCPASFDFTGRDRASNEGGRKRGGGVGIVTSQRAMKEIVTIPDYDSFDCLTIKLKLRRGKCVMLVLVYRPPWSSASAFLADFEDLMEEIFIKRYDNLVVLGDFNLHWGENERPSRILQERMAAFGLQQIVEPPTHRRGHTLDLIFINQGSNHPTMDVQVDDVGFSDHFLVSCTLSDQLATRPHAQRKCRKFKNMDAAAFCSDVERSLAAILQEDPQSSTDGKITMFNKAISDSLDTHAPWKTITLKGNGPKKWYDDEIHTERRRRRQLERKYKKTNLTIHKERMDEQSDKVVRLIQQKKRAFYQHKFQHADHKETFKLIKSLSDTHKEQPLPSDRDAETLVKDFSDFFRTKIKKIQDSLDVPLSGNALLMDTRCESNLTMFSIQSVDDMGKLLKGMPTKTCSLDPLPTWLLKEPAISNVVLPFITGIINSSLSRGHVPKELKVANICPRLKKPTADPNALENYRPVSNPPFLSKLLEKVVAKQIIAYLEDNDLMDPFQSAYRSAHSTETATLKVKCDADMILDDGDAVLLVLLDLSAAFDTLNHEILLKRLEVSIGLRGTALEWMKSYLSNRSQQVVIGDAASASTPLETGVPQGSVLGPLLFSLYTLPLRRIIEKHSLMRHHYADDVQLYRRLQLKRDPGVANSLQREVQEMEMCIDEIREWMTINHLKLNEKKTEVLVISLPSKRHLVSNITLRIGNDIITPSNQVRDLGSHLDQALNLRTHVSTTVRAGFFHMRSINRIRRHLTDDACAKIINAVVTSRQDYHNGLLAGSHQNVTQPLQRMQNYAARLLTRTKRNEHITPVLRRLHWLPVRQRMDFKILTFIHGALHHDGPSYLKDMWKLHRIHRPLRSSDDEWLLQVPRVRRHEGERSAVHHGAIVWNQLPGPLRQPMSKDCFKKQLKTFLFTR
jgi:hypothetical protein